MIDLFDRRNKNYGLSIADRIDAQGDCWEWTGCLDRAGYGKVSVVGKNWRVHRLVWTVLVGTIADGLVVDHQCRNHACCNPDHLRTVSSRVNTLENSAGISAKNAGKVRCRQGHPLVGDNVYVYPAGNRECLACRSLYYEANKERIATRSQDYYEANKERVAERGLRYREQRRELLAEKARGYRERRKHAGIG